ncbi:hypothetical protein FMUND_14334 [Fusarium mundagurra]|uniref:Uncharacterized protein n=1 Tax=Fusarium mundagurra TaxID=1567541 RepID=A0A8H6D2E9_9HYPO|nr:hypothetical protein FMUND_14334 [Fusarium mundagurra]
MDTPPRADVSEELWALVCSTYEENEKMTLDTIEGIIGDAEGVVRRRWDQQSEDEMEAKWQTSLRKKSSDVIGTRGNNDFHYRDLWRFCLRFLHQAPPIMLSPLNRLQFVPKRNLPITTSHLFTLGACLSLTQLIIHPIWEQNYRRFIDTLHYAATYRVGAFRNFDWTFFDEDACPALQILNHNLMEVEGPLPDTVHKLHVDARNVVVARGETPGVFSDLLCRIGELATVNESPSAGEQAQLENGIVPFNGSDLEVIKKAIDSLAATEPTIGYPVQAVYDAFKAAKNTADVLLKERLREFDAQTQGAVGQPGSSVSNPGRAARRPQNHQGSRYAPYSLIRRRQPSRSGPSDVDRSVVTDESVSAHDDFPPTGGDATPRSQGEHAELDSFARPQVRTPVEVMSSHESVMAEMKQLRQENAHLRQRVGQEIPALHREIKDMKTEQVRLIDDLKARLETRETEARQFSERLAELESERSEADSRLE